MKIPRPEQVGLPPEAGSFEPVLLAAQRRVVLGCVAPSPDEGGLLLGRVYSRAVDEPRYTLLGSLEPRESWVSPLAWDGGILVVSEQVSPSAGESRSTLVDYTGIKFVDFSGSPPKTIWAPPDRRIWIRRLLDRGESPNEVVCLVGRILPSANEAAQYSLSVLDLAHGNLRDMAVLASPAY